jgi:hypothetical protein
MERSEWDIVSRNRSKIIAMCWKSKRTKYLTIVRFGGKFLAQIVEALEHQLIQTTTNTSCVDKRERVGRSSGNNRRTSSKKKKTLLFSCHKLLSNTVAL